MLRLRRFHQGDQKGMMKSMKKFTLRKNSGNLAQAICFLIIFCITFVWLCMRNVTEFIYDSWWYWTIGDSIVGDGTWDILRFPETFRGYFCPIIFLLMKQLGEFLLENPYLIFRIFTALMLSCVLTIILPYIFDKKIKSVKDCIRILLVYSVVLLYWGDYLLYPLSDMIAFVLLSGGVALLKKMHMDITRNIMKIVFGICAGICLYASYNTRAVYIYGVIGVLVIYIYMEIRDRKTNWISMLALLIGVFLCAAPQSAINHQYTGSYSPKVYTEQYNNYQTGLEMLQVYWGFTVPNYMSYAGSFDEYPDPWVYFNDEVGEEILKREGVIPETLSVRELLRLFVKYPQDMVGIYTRHLVSLMTPMYLETYIHNMYISKGVILTLIILMWFVAGSYFLWSIKNKKINWILVATILAIFIPCFLQLAGAPEVRFFMPIHFVMYFYVLYYAEYGLCKECIKKNALTLVVVFFVLYILWISVVSDVLKSNVYKTLLINDTNVYEEQTESTSSE